MKARVPPVALGEAVRVGAARASALASDAEPAVLPSHDFRETLVRELGGPRTLCVGMQNPSTAEAADGGKNDPTISRLVGFTTRLGFGRLVVVNSYDRRATDPAGLYRWLYAMPTWDREEHRQRALGIAIREAKQADMFIAAWGNGHPEDKWPARFADGLVAAGIDLYALGFTTSGAPKHPLARGTHRIPDDQQPILWRAARRDERPGEAPAASPEGGPRRAYSDAGSTGARSEGTPDGDGGRLPEGMTRP